MGVSRQARARNAVSTAAASGASMAAVAPLAGSCRRTPKLSLRQRKSWTWAAMDLSFELAGAGIRFRRHRTGVRESDADRSTGLTARSAKGEAGFVFCRVRVTARPAGRPLTTSPDGPAYERKPAWLSLDLWYFHAMSLDVVDLRNFYAQRLGDVARRFVGRGIRARFADTRGLRVVGIGYPTPYLGLFREEAERCLAFMPAAQGVIKWPSLRPGLAALTDEFALPLADSAVDRVLLVHALEMSHAAGALLRGVWRV